MIPAQTTDPIPRTRHTRRTQRVRRTRRRGMSLVEVMVVIAIVLTLMSVLGIGVMQIWRQSQVQTTQLTLQRTGQSVVLHELQSKKIPDDLRQVFGADATPQDAWGTPIELQRPSGRWDLRSLGEDRAEGGTGFDRDLHYSELQPGS